MLNHVNAYSLNIALHVICSQHLRSTNHKCTHACFTFHINYDVQKMVKTWSTLVKSSCSWSSYLSIACDVLCFCESHIYVLAVIRQYTIVISESTSKGRLVFGRSAACHGGIVAIT
jgi:hypothetical protein